MTMMMFDDDDYSETNDKLQLYCRTRIRKCRRPKKDCDEGERIQKERAGKG